MSPVSLLSVTSLIYPYIFPNCLDQNGSKVYQGVFTVSQFVRSASAYQSYINGKKHELDIHIYRCSVTQPSQVYRKNICQFVTGLKCVTVCYLPSF